jgi:hypothetical protein
MSAIKTRDIRKVLTNKGFQIVDCRHHEMLWFFACGKKTSIRTRLSHGSDEYGDGLLGLMAKQLKLARYDLDRLIECSLTEAAYSEHLVNNGHVCLAH